MATCDHLPMMISTYSIDLVPAIPELTKAQANVLCALADDPCEATIHAAREMAADLEVRLVVDDATLRTQDVPADADDRIWIRNLRRYELITAALADAEGGTP